MQRDVDVIRLTILESDISEDERAESVQAEHERMLALQQKTNQRLRDLELANEEKSSLLRAALLDRENLPPELLELKRVETLRQIRERINGVIKAPPEVQPGVLDTTSSEIAETVLSSEAALDRAKKVSTAQVSYHTSPSSAFDAAVSTMRKQRLESSFSPATLDGSATTKKNTPEPFKSASEDSASSTGTGQTTWDRPVEPLSPPNTSTMDSEEYFSTLDYNDGVASSSLARRPRNILMRQHSLPPLNIRDLYTNR